MLRSHGYRLAALASLMGAAPAASSTLHVPDHADDGSLPEIPARHHREPTKRERVEAAIAADAERARAKKARAADRQARRRAR